jgi:GDP-D-mannose dehydratase
LKASYADPRKAKNNLGWEAKYKMRDVIKRMAMNE